MTSHTITLTEPIADLLDRQMAEKGYESVSEYLTDLVARDACEREAATVELGALLKRAKESGVSDRSLDDILAAARSRMGR